MEGGGGLGMVTPNFWMTTSKHDSGEDAPQMWEKLGDGKLPTTHSNFFICFHASSMLVSK